MAKNPWDFVDEWAKENVQATVYGDEGTAKQLAQQCIRDSRAAGFYDQSIVKAAGGNLESFMLDRLNSAVDGEVRRQVEKDKR